MACTYTINGKKYNEIEFTAWLSDQLTRILGDKDLENKDLILKERLFSMGGIAYSLDSFNQAVAKADSIRSEFGSTSKYEYTMSGSSGEDPDMVKIHDRPGYIGITSFVEEYGNPKKGIDQPIIDPFNESEWESKRRTELKKIGKSESEITAIIEQTKLMWGDLVKYGDEVHSIYECVFRDESFKDTPLLNTIGLRDSVITQATAFKNNLIAKYGKGDASKVKFYPELEISAKELDPDLKVLLGGKKVCGIIDLLVIDSDGNPHIFDYKTSFKDFDTWSTPGTPYTWSWSKKEHVKNQLAAYNAMLQQYGFPSATCEVIPIKLDVVFTDSTRSKISSITGITQRPNVTVPYAESGEIYGNWKVLVPVKVALASEETVDVINKYKTLFPMEHITSMNVRQFEATVDYYKKNRVKDVLSGDKEFGKQRYYFIKYETDGRREYAKDEDELNTKLEKYVEVVNQKKADEIYTLADTLKKALSGSKTIEDFVEVYGLQHGGFLKTQFGRYVDEGWSLASNDNMIRMGLFEFRKGARSEIIVITNSEIHNVINLGIGKSILGKTLEDEFVDSKEILPASNGNIEAMKAMVYIAEHPELFTDCKIAQIATINPWTGKKTNVLNSQWVYNYNRLVNAEGKDTALKPINQNLFYDDVTSLLMLADSYLQTAEVPTSLEELTFGKINLDPNVTTYTEEFIMDAIQKLRKKYDLKDGENYMVGNEHAWLAYTYLYETLLALRGLHTYSELEPGKWLSSGVRTGLYVNAPGFSPSTNFRVFDDVMQQFALEVRLAVQKQGQPLLFAFEKFYNKMGRAKIIGGEAKYFLRWFRRNPVDNSIDSSFSLKDPDCGEFEGEEKEALDLWLKTMAELRFRKPGFTDEQFEAEVERAKANGSYYWVPLTEAAFGRQVSGVGFGKAIKNKWQQYKELTADVFAGTTEDKIKYERKRKELYNKLNLDADTRSKLIERAIHQQGGLGWFETNLEDVMWQSLYLFNKQRLSRKYIPILEGMRVSIMANQVYGGAAMDETIRAFDKLVKSKFYGESIVDEGLQPYMRYIQLIKSGFSKLQLGFNLRSFFRELFQGTWMGISRSTIELLPGINFETYKDGAWHVITQAHKNFSNVSLLQQLNAQYGMANYSMSNIPRQKRTNWWGIKNFRTDTMFLTSSAPDFQHRMAILVAKMMGDGCWTAHHLDKNGVLQYDFEKDDRFKIYRSDDKSNPLYLEQKAEYLERIAELNRSGMTKEDGEAYKEGDPLPMAYTPKEIQSIKNFADLLYGHYDDESKSLMNDMFLGSMFMQYKTYTTARAEQWGLNPGVYNTKLLVHDKDEVTGEQLYKVHNDLDENGMPNIEVLTERQIKESGRDFNKLVEENRIEASVSWKGLPMEGMGRSYVKFAKKVLSLDWNGLKELWANPTERDNFILGLHDCLFMSLMMMLVTALFGVLYKGEWTTDSTAVAREVRKHGWGPSFMYNVGVGSFTDFPFWNVMGSMFSDINPSVLVSAKRIVNTTGNVIMGDKSVFQALTNTVGAFADFRGVADRIANTVEEIQ